MIPDVSTVAFLLLPYVKAARVWGVGRHGGEERGIARRKDYEEQEAILEKFQ